MTVLEIETLVRKASVSAVRWRNRVSHAETHRPSELLATLKEQGFRLAVSVPDSWLGQLLVEIENDPDMTLIRATHEEEALAIACGSRLGGVRTVMLIQNVGMTTMGAGMVSLAQRCQFPLLILASFRGSPDDPVYYHIPKGRVTEPVLQAMGLRYARVNGAEPIGPQVEKAAANAEESSQPFVLLTSQRDTRW